MRRIFVVGSILLALTGCSSTGDKKADESEPYVAATAVKQTEPIALTKTGDATFAQDVLNSKEPVFLDFNTTWCGPCKMMEPILGEMAGEYKGKVKFLSIDAEQNPIAAAKYSITGYPTFCVLIGGKVEGKILGARTKSELENLLTSSHAI